MNIYTASTAMLENRKEELLQEIIDIQDALTYVPESSILGHLSLLSTLKIRRRQLRKVEGELALRKTEE